MNPDMSDDDVAVDANSDADALSDDSCSEASDSD
jgi:hypothetical protein